MRDDLIHVPRICEKHLSDVNEAGNWSEKQRQKIQILLGLLLFQAAAGNTIVWERCGKIDQAGTMRDADDLSLVLAEIGCLGCFLPNAFVDALDIVLETGTIGVRTILDDEEMLQNWIDRQNGK